MPVPTLPTDDTIVEFCRQYGRSSNGYLYDGLAYKLNGGGTVWVKHGYHVQLAEARTQDHAFKAFQKMAEMGLGTDARIPEVYRFFERDRQTYIIMEYIDGETVKQRLQNSTDDPSLIYSKVSDALNQLLSITAPQNLPCLGPIGGGPIHHLFFMDYVSAIEYDTVEKLEQHVNAILKRGNYGKGYNRPAVDFKHDKVIFSFSDFNLDNFMIDKEGKVYILDFQHAGYLPESFMNLAVNFVTDNPLVKGILAKHPHWTSNSNLVGLRHARYLLAMFNNNRAGLKDVLGSTQETSNQKVLGEPEVLGKDSRGNV